MPTPDVYARHRDIPREIFLHALRESSIDSAFSRHVSYGRGVLRVADDLYELNSYSRVLAVSIGKAGHTMAAALARQLGTRCSGIVAAPPDPCGDEGQVPGFRYFEGGHPLPNAESQKAARAILRSLSSMNDRSLVLFLLSGGGSSLVEAPLDSEISLDDIIATYRALVLSGASIAEINAIRKHLSAVKGGRMAKAASRSGLTQQVSIMVSDVPEGALDALASGPTMPDSTSVEDCYAIAERFALLEHFPASVRELFQQRLLVETPDKDDPIFYRSRWWPVLSNSSVVKAAAAKAAEYGFAVEIDNSCDDWDYRRAADHLLARLRELRRGASRVCLISGGEVTVKVEGSSGIGGRNQQFVLYCAGRIARESITVLSAGTDGVDGNSDAAGAIADGATLERAQKIGLSSDAALQGFNATPFFRALGNDLTTGPTGNNLRDLRILLAY